MGTELQAKYQQLAHEYAKLRSQVDVLKRAVRDEQSKKNELQETARETTLNLRKYVQENESLEFRNQQLSKRVAMLQDDLNSPKTKKKKAGEQTSGVSVVHTQELAAKISENERLHMKILELTQKSERTVQDLEAKISSLEREVASHNAGVEEVSREYKSEMEVVKNEKALIEAKLAVQLKEGNELRKTVLKLQQTKSEKDEIVQHPVTTGLMQDSTHSKLNLPVVDNKQQTRVISSLSVGCEIMSTLSTQLSTFHSYLEQRCKIHPVDTSRGTAMSEINLKLCELLHESSVYTRAVTTQFSNYHSNLVDTPFSQTAASDLKAFCNAHGRFVAYLQALGPYFEMSLQLESKDPSCGSQLKEANEQIAQQFSRLTNNFASLQDCIDVICNGAAQGIPPSNAAHCVSKLRFCLARTSDDLADMSDSFSNKVSLEYNLPAPSQKLNTTNECVVSVLNGLQSTTQQLTTFLKSKEELFCSSFVSGIASSLSTEDCQSTILQSLRERAIGYAKKLSTDCPESVPYSLSVHQIKSHAGSSESRNTYLKQATVNQEKLEKLEQEKEQLLLDLQLMRVKFEKEQKKVSSFENSSSQPETKLNSTSTLSTSTRALSDSAGCLSAVSAEDQEKEISDEMVMVRQHFIDRITELGIKAQEADSKAAHYYAECRGLHKQLDHSSLIRTKLAKDLETTREALQQLQDQMATTSSSYEKQLSAMSDHLCEVNDKLLKQSEELETLQKGNKGRRMGKT